MKRKLSERDMAIPTDCMPVVRVLRRDVKRPAKDTLTVSKHYKQHSARFTGLVCPLGLHPMAKQRVPIDCDDFRETLLLHYEISAFYRWWDSLTLDQAREAVDLIWPKAARLAKRKGAGK